MIYGSVCSGIEAASVAWDSLGWKPAFFSEIEKFPRAVLSHHYPETPLHGDFTTIKEEDYGTINLLVGGTPCQSFSIAGLRKGMDDDRGNLALEFIRLARRKNARWVLWENVPGVLSSSEGRDFASFIAGLRECGYSVAYRILDAKYFGVPQRRRRIFVVGYLGGWQYPAAVLFEQACLRGDIAPVESKGKNIAARAVLGLASGKQVTGPLCANAETKLFLGNQEAFCGDYHVVSYGIQANIIDRKPENGGNGFGFSEETAPTLTKMDRHAVAPINLQVITRHKSLGKGTGFGLGEDGDPAYTMGANHSHGIASGQTLRRLTPLECERLQGFPDNYTNIPYNGKPESSDAPRYKALGNSMAVPVMRWLGERIQAVETLITEGK